MDMQNYATFRGANGYLMSPTKDFSFSDNVTWLKGDHTFKGGGLLIRNFKDQNGRSEYPGYVHFTPTGNSITSLNAFADALLGNFRTYREAQLDPIGYFRFWQFEAFGSDAWRVSPKLSVEYGIRYAFQMPTLTLGRNTTSFDPAHYDPARAVSVYNDHKEDISGIVDAALVGEIENAGTSSVEVEFWMTGTTTTHTTAAQVRSDPSAVRVWGPFHLEPGERRAIGWDQSAALFAGQQALIGEIKGDGQFTLYPLGPSAATAYRFIVHRGVLVVTIDAGI